LLFTKKEALLDNCGYNTNFGWEWSLGWRRNLFDWEQVQLKKLLEEVHNLCPVLEKADRWIWIKDLSHGFSVSYAYMILRGGRG